MDNQFKIAKIISDTSFIITGGINQGVKKHDKFIISGKKGEEVLDPDTGESLGTLDSIKGEIHVTELFPNMALATSETYKVGGLGLEFINSSAPAYNTMFGIEKNKSLNVDLDQVTGLDYQISSNDPIQIGDIVSPI